MAASSPGCNDILPCRASEDRKVRSARSVLSRMVANPTARRGGGAEGACASVGKASVNARSDASLIRDMAENIRDVGGNRNNETTRTGRLVEKSFIAASCRNRLE